MRASEVLRTSTGAPYKARDVRHAARGGWHAECLREAEKKRSFECKFPV